jgi:tryptophanase
MEEVGNNVFFFPSEMIFGCDLLSDSGTTSMTNKQWAALHLADEAYGSNRGYFLLLNQIKELFGDQFASDPTKGTPDSFIFHQGRPTEDALFSALGKLGKNLIIPSNGHFDTTHANIEAGGIKAVNLFSKELKDNKSDFAFKGNIDLVRLEKLLVKSKKQIPVVYLTITNNTGGGQPVSMENIKQTSMLVKSFDIPLFFDACRFAENAWFIKQKENGYKNKSVAKIVREMFSYVDGFTISFKKDGLVNMGGGLFLNGKGLFVKKYPKLPDELVNYQIIKEGHPTYGGMSGRDIMALYEGLRTVTTDQYLAHRVGQVERFGEKMNRMGLPVVTPIGGHAVYLDMDKFFEGTKMTADDFGGIAFTALLLGLYGHRAVELGNFAFGEYNPKTGKEVFPEVNFVRFAIPRLRYEDQDLAATAEAVEALYKNRDLIPKAKVVYGKELPLRHFKARFKLT